MIKFAQRVKAKTSEKQFTTYPEINIVVKSSKHLHVLHVVKGRYPKGRSQCTRVPWHPFEFEI